ncbi:17179_t:CDS:2 [Cetraspora pellucida]|uniref:17179_t:CDS:1 n=1 Tax=Cetraspora pellucida TaxID=1433469 RepID=A0A9N9EAV9_9GLOM|nr:17179_t:CDS:2 [Cetraspora pellucida]
MAFSEKKNQLLKITKVQPTIKNNPESSNSKEKTNSDYEKEKLEDHSLNFLKMNRKFFSIHVMVKLKYLLYYNSDSESVSFYDNVHSKDLSTENA